MKNETLQEIVSEELSEKIQNIEQISEGLRHPTYRVLIQGESYILQVSSVGEGREKELERTFQVYEILEDENFPAPETVEIGRAKINDVTKTFSIVRDLEGVSLEEKGLTPELTRRAGKLLGRIHRFDDYEETGWLKPGQTGFKVIRYPEGEFKKHILEKWEDKIQIFEKNDWNDAADEVRKFYDRYGDELPDYFQPVFCHNDFSPDNIILRHEEVRGVIDFDYAHSGHSQRDLVKAANSFWMTYPGSDWDIRQTLYDGYREVHSLDESFEKHEPIYRVETLVGTIASLLEMEELETREKEFYRENLMRIIQEAESELERL